MKEVKFDKRCLAGKLHRELEAAGFAVYGVSTSDDLANKKYETIVHLKDEETKDPSSVVDAHAAWSVEADRDAIRADAADEVEFALVDLEAGADPNVAIEIYRRGESEPTATDKIALEYDADRDALVATYRFATDIVDTWILKFAHRNETQVLEVDAVA